MGFTLLPQVCPIIAYLFLKKSELAEKFELAGFPQIS